VTVIDLMLLNGDRIRARSEDLRTRDRLTGSKILRTYLLKPKYLRFQRVKSDVILVRDPFNVGTDSGEEANGQVKDANA
jgi:hypothetical protein